MAKIKTEAAAEEVTLHVVVTHADGTVEDHGEVAYYHKNPLRRWLRPLQKKVMGWRRSS